ncbi:uncharacterized protein [Rhodnius prolixus]|uniref:uncharacterized protein n=1 Tax=Rhodnius prolixus TaxID=13249 RepID=UPI003D18DD1B
MEARRDTLKKWQEEWESCNKAAWTRVLIPRIEGWYDRKHGQVNFYLAQFLTGHGCFKKYLNTMRKVESPCCVYCKEVQDNARHRFFECKRWDEERMELELEIGSITPENIVGKVLAVKSNWTKVDKTVCDILKKKKVEDVYFS